MAVAEGGGGRKKVVGQEGKMAGVKGTEGGWQGARWDRGSGERRTRWQGREDMGGCRRARWQMLGWWGSRRVAGGMSSRCGQPGPQSGGKR